MGLFQLSQGDVNPWAGQSCTAGAVLCCWASLLRRASFGIAFSPCLFRFKINLTFPCSDLCKHGTSMGRELLLARGEPSLYPACGVTVPSG